MSTPFRFDPDLPPVIRVAAVTAGLQPELLAAIVWQESRGDRHATRYESAYRWLWDVYDGKPFRRLTADERFQPTPPADFRGPTGATAPKEWIGQRTSWGLCQIMGATARQLGFQGVDFEGLFDPATNLTLGARLLAKLTAKWELADAISAYNAGAPTEANNEKYVRPVMRQMAAFEKDGF